MKKIVIFLAVVFLNIQGLSAQTTDVVQGTVINTYNSTPVANQAVYIYTDSSQTSFPYYATVYTNSNGFYADTIYSIPYQTIFYASTSDCNGTWVTDTVVSTSTPMVANFSEYCNPMGCQAAFTAYPDTSLVSFNYYFYDQSNPSTGNINSWSWTFGDGGTSTQQYPMHTYSAVGVYYVCLTITTNLGCNDTYCDSVQVDSTNIPPCQTGFQYIVNAYSVSFYGYTGNSLGATYSWNFDDFSTSSLQNPVHNYTSYGTYYVCLTTTDGNGCVSSSCQYVYVGTTPPCSAQFYLYPEFLDASSLLCNKYGNWNSSYCLCVELG